MPHQFVHDGTVLMLLAGHETVARVPVVEEVVEEQAGAVLGDELLGLFRQAVLPELDALPKIQYHERIGCAAGLLGLGELPEDVGDVSANLLEEVLLFLRQDRVV